MTKDSKMLELILRVLEKEATFREKQELEAWLQADSENLKFFEVFSRYWRIVNQQPQPQRPDVDSIWKDIAEKIDLDDSKKMGPFSPRQKPSGIWSRRFLYPAAIAILVLLLYGIYWFSLPEYYHLAKLQVWEQKSLAQATRSTEAEPDEFTHAAEELISAKQKRLGLLPYFDQEQVRRAIIYLQRAFESSSDPFTRNKCAYYLGKAYLMQGDLNMARYWLQKVLESPAKAYQKEASQLLDKLL